ncbi:hypothetical protein [Janibacter melonis]|uniref:hypothetical protein n=1 Tax=Janibacter melonis TaxID=262209 RepID=UPI001E52AAB0|nr:hypothetical protein [Janibacter melonis]MCB5992993.1 hypothetical protein [Janibacter melonis]
MTVTHLTTTAPASAERRLTCTWVPVRGEDGRTRMEMRWVEPAPRRARHAA